MVFSSLLFLFLFLSITMIIYYLMPDIFSQNIVLLCASLIFYAWNRPSYLILLLAMTFIAWFSGVTIDRKKEEAASKMKIISPAKYERIVKNQTKPVMVAAVVLMLAILGYFKYTGFFLSNIQFVTGFPKEIPEIILPIGISFYTFQLLSYVVDVYRGDVPAQTKFYKLLLYSSLFHQCIAGPIVRYKTVNEDIDKRVIRRSDITQGVRRFAIGLAKKAILANSCATIADKFMANPSGQVAAAVWLGMVGYAFQIYFDFSAYSDMAIGMGRLAGFHYEENFDYPYIAESVQEFWRRWHISLATFFKDYVYFPLGGSRKGELITVRNMFIVWFLTGLWHGANWNYIIWGLYYYVFQVFERYALKKVKDRIPAFVLHIYALIVINLGWPLFYYNDLADIGSWFKSAFSFRNGFFDLASKYGWINNIFLLIFCAFAVTPVFHNFRRKFRKKALAGNKAAMYLATADSFWPIVLMLLSVCALVGNSYNPFIYFQF